MSLRRLVRLAATAPFRAPEQVSFSTGELEQDVLGRGLPKGFLLGAATASHQVEGGNENDWTDWERSSFPDGKPHIADRTQSGLACDSWNRFDEDLRLLKELGANAYRLSLEWSRLEPSEGDWNLDAVERYRGWLQKLKGAGISPMVTLHHFTLPRWVARDGGWSNELTVDRFARFVRRCRDAFAEWTDLWCTINEPNVLALQGYLKGIWPPGKQDAKETGRVMARLMRAHAKVTPILREKDRRPSGIAHHVRVFHPAHRSSPIERILCALSDDFVNQVIVDCHRTGRIQLVIPGQISIDEAVPDLAGSFDYLGLNYYSRDHVEADFKDPALSRLFVPAGRPVTDLQWEIYPEGLYLVLKRYGSLGIPVYVTENGIADNDGTKRAAFLKSHFHALQRAVKEGADVRGYYHWSLMDNFEWAEGFVPRFGLYRVDFDRPERSRVATEGVGVFQAIARNLALAAPAGGRAGSGF